MHISKEKHTKLESKSIPGILIGYDEHSKAYRCYEPTKRKIMLSRDVIFDETKIRRQPVEACYRTSLGTTLVTIGIKPATSTTTIHDLINVTKQRKSYVPSCESEILTNGSDQA
jgi:hypothetical protein